MGGPADERGLGSLRTLGTDASLQTVASAALGSMPLEQQAVFALAIEQGLSYPEIARRLRISEDSIKLHIRDGLTSLRREVIVRLAAVASPRRHGTAEHATEDQPLPAVVSP